MDLDAVARSLASQLDHDTLVEGATSSTSELSGDDLKDVLDQKLAVLETWRDVVRTSVENSRSAERAAETNNTPPPPTREVFTMPISNSPVRSQSKSKQQKKQVSEAKQEVIDNKSRKSETEEETAPGNETLAHPVPMVESPQSAKELAHLLEMTQASNRELQSCLNKAHAKITAVSLFVKDVKSRCGSDSPPHEDDIDTLLSLVEL